MLVAQIMAKLDKMHEAQSSECKHEFGFAGNPGKVCGVCSSMWEPGCGWAKGKGNWACFSCQVYICKWECLNVHNKEGTGARVKAPAVIYTQDEWAEKQDEE